VRVSGSATLEEQALERKLSDVPTDERTAKVDRCDLHPGSASVAVCDGCGRPMCVRCAIPVRGLVYGAECVLEDVGERPAPPPTREPISRWLAIAGVAAGIALAATVLPWSKFGSGSSVFGAWSTTPRWSMLAAVCSLVGVLLWMIRIVARGRSDRRSVWWFAAFELGAAAGALFAFLNPPPFARPGFALWVSFTAALVAATAALVAALRSAGPRAARMR
jgi:hypothetical protein